MRIKLTTVITVLAIPVLVLLAGCMAINSPPVASFTCNPSSGESPLTVSFDASSSHDSDGTIVAYAWKFGDGNTETGMTISHIYTTTSNRAYTITLTVTDDDGAQATANHVISVTPPPPNSPPVARFTRTPSSGEAPLNVSFNASASSDPDGSIASYAWSFGDGGSSSGVTASHTYTSAGTYTARLTVTDNDGATDSVTHSILVQPPTPAPSDITVWITASESEIDILSYEIEHRYSYDELVGRAKNVTSRTLDWVTIHARLLDEDDVQIDTTLDIASDVLPNATFEFSLYIWEPERTKTIEIYEITTFTW